MMTKKMVRNSYRRSLVPPCPSGSFAWRHCSSVQGSIFYGSSQVDITTTITTNIITTPARVAGLGRLSAGAKIATKPFVKRVFTIFATNASFLRVISNFRIYLSKICNIYHVIVHFLPKKHCFYPKRHFLCPKISKKSA